MQKKVGISLILISSVPKINQLSSSACLASTLAIYRMLLWSHQIQTGTPHLTDRPKNSEEQKKKKTLIQIPHMK